MRDQTLRIIVRQFETFERSIAEMWSAYQAQSGSKLQLEAVPMDLHSLQEAAITSGGMRDGDWDIAHLNTDLIAEAKAAGALLDLKSLLEANPPEDYPHGWTDSMLGFQDFGEAIVGAPFHDGPECLIYRTDLFDSETERGAFKKQTGKDLTPPKTWDNFLSIARFFQRPEQNLYGTVFAAYPDGHNTVFDFALQLWTRGGELVDDTGRVVVDSSAAAEGLAFYRDILQDTSAVHPNCRDMDSVKTGLAFARGEVAMMVNWFGFAGMSEVVPESVVKGKVDITDLPAAPGCQSASLNCYWMYTIASGSPHSQVAYDFVRFMINAENDKKLTLNGGTGCRKSTWHDKEVNKTVPYYHRLEPLHANARTFPRAANWSEQASVIDQLVLDTIDTERSIASILAEAQAKLDAL